MNERSLPRIVIAEDEPASRRLLERHLTRVGYEVIACENGQEALDAIRKEGSCIVVADWMMPEMDGLELCRAVREMMELNVLSFVYFILLTAHTDKDQTVAGLEAGADDYLTKPYHKQELLARLRTGERFFSLQNELRERQLELRKANNELGKLNNKLEQQANTDALTGLNNRRCLFERFSEAWALSERSNEPLACIMFDIDKFKLVNDTYGHSAGDHVLKGVADIARRSLRAYDILGRFGGEEFCIASPRNGMTGAAAVAERIRSSIAEAEFVFDGNTIPVTVSLGVALRTDAHSGPEALISAADEMLYKAKEGGRNQVWVLDADGRGHRLEELVQT